MPVNIDSIHGHEWGAIIFFGVWVVTFLGIHLRWAGKQRRILLDPIFGVSALAASFLPAAVAGFLTILLINLGLDKAIAGFASIAAKLGSSDAWDTPVPGVLLLFVCALIVAAMAAYLGSEFELRSKAAADVRSANPKIVVNRRLYKQRINERVAELKAVYPVATFADAIAAIRESFDPKPKADVKPDGDTSAE